MISIKVPILMGKEIWGFSLRPLQHHGIWPMLHEARNDLCMLFGATFRLIVGAGRWSFDARFSDEPAQS